MCCFEKSILFFLQKALRKESMQIRVEIDLIENEIVIIYHGKHLL
jgi:hypothetical protein